MEQGKQLPWRKRLGLLKSIAIYYWKPFNRRRLKRFYSQFIGTGDLCFDLGAHVGNRTATWVDLGARVVAVEPQPACVDYLQRRFGGSLGVTLVAKAIGAIEGKHVLHINSANPTISTLSDEAWRAQLARDARYPISWDEVIEVEVTTLDALIALYGIPAFCKLDVENFEFEALRGLSSPLPLLSFEYYPPRISGAYQCLDRLCELGEYEYNWSFGESMRLASTEWIDNQQIRKVIGQFKSRYDYGDIYARLLHN